MSARALLLRLAGSLALALLLAFALLVGGPASASTTALTRAASVLVVGLLLAPGEAAPSRASVASWSGCLSLGALALSLPELGMRASALGLALATGVLGIALLGCARALARTLGRASNGAVLVAACVLAGLPLWLGPLAERVPALISLALAPSPLTYLAVMGEIDYLRAEWLYSHSPLGSLQFTYPGRVALSAAWVAVGGAALLVNFRPGR